jgi:3-isopropylmalate dehydrogenase
MGERRPSGAWVGLYEPVHGSAPDIAGLEWANPIGAIASVAALLEFTFGLIDEAAAIREAIDNVVAGGTLTRDLNPRGTPATTREMGEAVCAEIR